jgi:glycosyltransferase involved in cell wall biosynthesis
MSPRTSVIIPVRDGARFIAEAIRSALPQLSLEDEMIVVDDASADTTRAVVEGLNDPRIRLLEGLGRGVSAARNTGIAAASSEFVAFLDHDDLWPQGRHAALSQALLADEAIDCAFGRMRLRMEPDAVLLPQLADMDGSLSVTLSLCTGLFRRRILDRVGPLDERMPFGEDTDYLIRLIERKSRAVLCDADALIYRRHGSNATCNTTAAEDGVMQLIRRRRIRTAAANRSRR